MLVENEFDMCLGEDSIYYIKRGIPTPGKHNCQGEIGENDKGGHVCFRNALERNAI